jgi:hypothetical protein
MSYRVITSDYIMSKGSYQPIDGTEMCVGEGYNYKDAHFTALQNDTRYKLSWYQKLHDGLWYECDSNGNALLNILADPQEVPFEDHAIEDMADHPEDYSLDKDQNGNYIIPTKSVPKVLVNNV